MIIKRLSLGKELAKALELESKKSNRSVRVLIGELLKEALEQRLKERIPVARTYNASKLGIPKDIIEIYSREKIYIPETHPIDVLETDFPELYQFFKAHPEVYEKVKGCHIYFPTKTKTIQSGVAEVRQEEERLIRTLINLYLVLAEHLPHKTAWKEARAIFDKNILPNTRLRIFNPRKFYKKTLFRIHKIKRKQK